MTELLILFAVSLAVSAVGWKYFIYFFSLGYGYGIVALAVAMMVMFGSVLSAPTVALCVLLIVFGMRLGTYLLLRERKATAYRKILYDPSLQKKKPVGVIVTVWLFCAILYVLQVSPVAFRLMNTKAGAEVSDLWAWIGSAVVLCGILLEAFADIQKSAAKKRNPKRFVDTGLYRIVRCPNYLGEVTIWTGAMLSGIGAGLTWWQWLIAAVGYIGIVYVMFSGARRLELRQNEVYGTDPEYQAYVKKTPILIPFLPIYSVERYKWLQA
jgi:steroid 5-alpha reductase family enzyme